MPFDSNPAEAPRGRNGDDEQDAAVAFAECVCDHALPTDAQTDAFAQYVAGAHSWYKHLPQLPPGRPFLFFLNPNSGRDLVQSKDGQRVFIDRTDDSPVKFHYTWRTTRAYRSEFGIWDYHQPGGPTSYLMGLTPQGWVHEATFSDHRAVLHPRRGWLSLPKSLTTASICRLTAWVDRVVPQWVIELAFSLVDDFDALRREHPDDPDVARYARLADLVRAAAPLWKEEAFIARYRQHEDDSEARAALKRAWDEAERMMTSERQIMRQRMRDTLFAARAAAQRLLEAHGHRTGTR